MLAGYPTVQIRFPVLQGPIPAVPIGRLLSSPGLAQGTTKPLCLCDKLRQNDAERASKKKRSR